MLITEDVLRKYISEAKQSVLKEEVSSPNQFDNITDEGLAKLEGNYYSVIIPEWSLNAFVNGDYTGLNENEILDITGFKRYMKRICDISDVGQYFVPMDGIKPSFYNKNDIGGGACNCYKFAIPA